MQLRLLDSFSRFRYRFAVTRRIGPLNALLLRKEKQVTDSPRGKKMPRSKAANRMFL